MGSCLFLREKKPEQSKHELLHPQTILISRHPCTSLLLCSSPAQVVPTVHSACVPCFSGLHCVSLTWSEKYFQTQSTFGLKGFRCYSLLLVPCFFNLSVDRIHHHLCLCIISQLPTCSSIQQSTDMLSFSMFSGLISLLLAQTLLPVLSEVQIDHQLGSC